MCCCCLVVCQFSAEHKSFLYRAVLQILQKFRLTKRARAFANIICFLFTDVSRLFGGIAFGFT